MSLCETDKCSLKMGTILRLFVQVPEKGIDVIDRRLLMPLPLLLPFSGDAEARVY